MDNKGLQAWEANAEFWDNYMGDNSNDFHRNLVRPMTESLLQVKEDDFILDIACGNGNFSSHLAHQNTKVVAFDYSPKMIALAKKRRSEVLDKVEFHVCDATNLEQLLSLKKEKPFDKAVANMAIMDIYQIQPLFQSVYTMLAPQGSFVFSMHHPAFTYPNNDYFTQCTYQDIAIEGQPSLQNYYHRPLEYIFDLAFKNGFTVTGFHEIPFENEKTPIIMILRLQK